MQNRQPYSGKRLPRLSQKEFIVLSLLVSAGEMFGLEMVEKSGGELKRGTAYVTLQRMGEKGFVESREEPRQAPEIGLPRRKYTATELGQRAFRAQAAANKEFELTWGAS